MNIPTLMISMFVSAILYLLFPALQTLVAALDISNAVSSETATETASHSSNTLLVNAIVGKNNVSSVECWAVQPGFQPSSATGGELLQLGSLSNLSYSLWPSTGSPIDIGFHNAPTIQWVVMLVGGANITFPGGNTPNLTVLPGELFIAADVVGTSTVGHRTVGDSGSIVLQMPFREGVTVNHTVVNRSGACR